jgi:hypothetical protein
MFVLLQSYTDKNKHDKHVDQSTSTPTSREVGITILRITQTGIVYDKTLHYLLLNAAFHQSRWFQYDTVRTLTSQKFHKTHLNTVHRRIKATTSVSLTKGEKPNINRIKPRVTNKSSINIIWLPTMQTISVLRHSAYALYRETILNSISTLPERYWNMMFIINPERQAITNCERWATVLICCL